MSFHSLSTLTQCFEIIEADIKADPKIDHVDAVELAKTEFRDQFDVCFMDIPEQIAENTVKNFMENHHHTYVMKRAIENLGRKLGESTNTIKQSLNHMARM